MLTPEQCRVARAILEISSKDFAVLADISCGALLRFERGASYHSTTLKKIEAKIEARRDEIRRRTLLLLQIVGNA